ncbi:hypothetical protein QO010_002608 [Caulobacter ginsengisoli]|uniref:DUF2834 domain-containing protein n=1 Tax=Caulobacter ginsengisoli TaxID=400775 RepID=A0ABU0IS65_9CAUL|nr:DUF2834 domain-containing protein [Caulobacter ginsengisoli]MDQ0464824.1 hypothetical protein [Caulobacter ginsengisoli]
MTATQRGLCLAYGLIAALALIATWSQNLAYFGGGPLDAFVRFLIETKANPASRSITVDIGFFLLAAAVWMVVEARKLKIRFVWLYVIFGYLVAISVTFPLFLIAREMRLAVQDGAPPPARLTASDLIGLGLVAASAAALSWFLLLS